VGEEALGAKRAELGEQGVERDGMKALGGIPQGARIVHPEINCGEVCHLSRGQQSPGIGDESFLHGVQVDEGGATVVEEEDVQ